MTSLQASRSSLVRSSAINGSNRDYTMADSRAKLWFYPCPSDIGKIIAMTPSIYHLLFNYDFKDKGWMYAHSWNFNVECTAFSFKVMIIMTVNLNHPHSPLLCPSESLRNSWSRGNDWSLWSRSANCHPLQSSLRQLHNLDQMQNPRGRGPARGNRQGERPPTARVQQEAASSTAYYHEHTSPEEQQLTEDLEEEYRQEKPGPPMQKWKQKSCHGF